MVRLFKRADFYLIVFLCLVGVFSFVPRLFDSGNLTATVSRRGEVLYTIDLEKVEKAYTITVDDRSPKVEIMVKHGEIGFVKADCPDKICVKTGMLTKPGQSAACLPAKLIITLSGKASGHKVPDIITY
ncbi:MAG TPA: NusG domain II-containing protein [Clostridiales bacterium]|nr:NusG domain II-containing protein [Clostridiales bacterium]